MSRTAVSKWESGKGYPNIASLKDIAKFINILSLVIILITVIGRLLSGVHWFTDILGGIFISIALLITLYSIIFIKK